MHNTNRSYKDSIGPMGTLLAVDRRGTMPANLWKPSSSTENHGQLIFKEG